MITVALAAVIAFK